MTSGLLTALAVNAAAAALAIGLRLVRPSAAWGGMAVGTLVYWGTTWRGFVILFAFFVLGVSLTRLGYRTKAARGLAEPNEGRRGSAHALANGGVPALASILPLVWPETLAWVAVFVVGAFGAAISDTAGSEIGQLWGRRAVSPRTWRAVPPGTPGAVSKEGTLAALLAPGVLAALAYGIGFVGIAGAAGGLAGGFAGGMAESVAGTAARFRTRGHMQLNAGNTLLGGAIALGIVAVLRGTQGGSP